MGKKPYQEPALPTKDLTLGFRPFTPLPDKKVSCPKCGKIGEMTSKRNPEGQFIYKCRNCRIEYSQHLKLAFCTFRASEKNGSWLVEKATQERVLVRPIKPSDCRACPNYSTYIALNKQCPCWKGSIGKQLEPPEQWEKT